MTEGQRIAKALRNADKDAAASEVREKFDAAMKKVGKGSAATSAKAKADALTHLKELRKLTGQNIKLPRELA